MKKVRVGIVGVGGMGSSHSRYLLKGEVERAKLTAVCDIDPAKLEGFSEVQVFSDSAELIRSGEVDAIIIATPHYFHTTIGIDALDNGVHVLTEKPISVHKADCERLIAAHHAHKDLVFSAMFQMRTNPVWKRIKQFIDEGEIGEIVRTNWAITAWYRTQAYYDSGGWRATWKGEGGGVLLNQCPHNLDLFQWMCGMPSRIRAFLGIGKFHNIEVEDDVTAYLEYPNGATGLFLASTGEAPGTDRLEISGDRGKLIYEHGALLFRRNSVGTKEFTQTATGGFDRPECWDCKIPIKDAKTGHAVITQNFVNAILDGEPLIAPAEEGIRSVELANAMIYSSLMDQTVELPLDGAAYEAQLKELIAGSRFEKKTADSSDADISASFRM
ncbi:MAG TPA: Gfo/Idh/MocA family oxidoreductase [Candidatus Hydrogenedentes bacterium]|nr:Gfo/Idh/MocA family oxidoreductase [Candidatus Hydrogenedentota bacterium]HPG68405.1 Gfo/Idh/MocA family oxidoreductase [Candidatus Hydrogenedentota bacterium]